MKTIAKRILLALFLLMPLSAIADQDEVSTILIQSDEEDDDESDHRYKDGKGLRSAPVPITCVIDFAHSSVVIGLDDEIITYEIWSADQAVCLFVSDSDMAFVEALSGLKGEYCIRFLSESRCYKGWIDL